MRTISPPMAAKAHRHGCDRRKEVRRQTHGNRGVGRCSTDGGGRAAARPWRSCWSARTRQARSMSAARAKLAVEPACELRSSAARDDDRSRVAGADRAPQRRRRRSRHPGAAAAAHAHRRRSACIGRSTRPRTWTASTSSMSGASASGADDPGALHAAWAACMLLQDALGDLAGPATP